MKQKGKKQPKGFSLMELIIAMFIFVLMITVAVSVFANVVKTRKDTRSLQKNLEAGRTAIELMAKNIRMSSGLTTFNASHGIRMFNNSQDRCIVYNFTGGDLKTGLGPIGNTNCGGVSAGNDVIDGGVSGSFVVVPTDIGSGFGDSDQDIGRATININIGSGFSQEHLQTTVSFRDYEGIFYEN
jgi:prepilin-type N-terminal cleavage/methylation domain-containing protein